MVGIVDPYMVVNSGTFRPIRVESAEGLHHEADASGGRHRQEPDHDEDHGGDAQGDERHRAPARGSRQSRTGVHVQLYRGSIPRQKGVSPTSRYREAVPGRGPTRTDRTARTCTSGRFMNTPVEAVELEYPVMVERYQFIPDSGGPGKWRGGLSLRRDIRVLTDVLWARYADRQKFSPQGLFGGKKEPGARSS